MNDSFPQSRNILVSISLLLILGCPWIFYSCQPSEEDFTTVVVEGWIEADRGPVVLITRSANLTAGSEVAGRDLVLPMAKVTVSDGQETVTLIGGLDDRFIPGYAYTTSRMNGVCGKTYTLHVDVGQQTLTATTTIPLDRPVLDTLYAEPTVESNGMLIHSTFSDPIAPGNRYLFFTQIYPKEKRLFPCPQALFADDVNALTDSNAVVLFRGIHRLSNHEELYTPVYQPGDSVIVAIASVDDESYRIQRAISETTLTSYNPLFSSVSELPTNIHGGTGYWMGLSMSRYYFVIPDFTAKY